MPLPHDGLHDKGSGAELAAQYKTNGLKMLEEHATHAAGGNGVEAGITEMLERMRTDRDDRVREQRFLCPQKASPSSGSSSLPLSHTSLPQA